VRALHLSRFLGLGLGLGLILTFLVPSAAARQTADLRPKFEKGQETKYRMEIDTQSVTESPDPEADSAPASTKAKPGTKPEPKGLGTIKATQKMTQSLGLRFKVINVDAQKTATVELIYDSLKVSIDGPEGKGDFDSSKPSSKPLNEPASKPARKEPADGQTLNIDPLESGDPTANFGSIVGSVLTLTIDKDGNITKVSGGEGLVPTTPGDPARSLVTLGGVKELWGPIFTMRKATGTATVGEKWKTSDTTDMSPIGRFTITTESVLKSLSEALANVEFKGTIAPSVESAGGLMSFQVKDSTHEGSYRWDTRRGMLSTLDMKQVVEIEGGSQGFKLNSKSTTKTSVTRVE